jgi:hypothetical protein
MEAIGRAETDLSNPTGARIMETQAEYETAVDLVVARAKALLSAIGEMAETPIGVALCTYGLHDAIEQIENLTLTPAPKSDILGTSQECDQRGLATRSDS